MAQQRDWLPRKEKNREKKFTFSPAHPTIPVTTLTASG